MEDIRENKKTNRPKKLYIIAAIITLAAVIAGVVILAVHLSKRINYDDSLEFELREGCSNFYYGNLSANQKKMYRMLYKEAEDILFNCQDKSTLGVYRYADYGLNKDEAIDVWYAFRYDSPAYFMISNSYVALVDSIEVTISPEFTDSQAREKVLQGISDSVERVKQSLDGLDDVAWKFKIIYDFVTDSTEYKRTESGEDVFDGFSYSIAGPLDGDESTDSICQGYASSISYLCNVFGIECIYVGSGYKNHAVNIVKIRDTWYYADATYDDEVTGYNYFLRGKDDLWTDLIKSSDNANKNHLLKFLPQLEYGNFDFVVSNGALTYRVLDKKYCEVTDCDKSVTSIVIPARIGDMEILSIAGAFKGRSDLISVEISDGVMRIDSEAFFGCTNLKRVSLPSSLTSIGSSAFYNCSSLTSVELPDGIKTIGSYAFQNCVSLTDIELPSSVTKIAYSAFSGCSALTSVKSRGNVNSIDNYAFYGCGNLTDIELPDTLAGIGAYAFYGCSSLTSVNIPRSLTRIGEFAFDRCSGLTGVYISDLARWCNIDFASSSSNPLYYARNLYLNGSLLKELLISDNITALKDYVFYNSSSLESVELPSGITSVGNAAFHSCGSLESVKLPDTITSIGDSAFHSCSSLTSVELLGDIASVDNFTFYNCNNLISIELPSGVKSIGNWAFAYCNGLTEIVMPDEVEEIGAYAFYNCNGLANLELPSRLQSIGDWAISGCDGLTEIVIPDGVIKIGDSAFLNCRRLTSVEIPLSVIEIGQDAFSYCNSLIIYCEADSLPSGWDSRWNSSDRHVVWGVNFNDPTEEGLKWSIVNDEIIITGFLGNDAEVIIPSEIDGHKVTGISDYAFYNCSSLTGIVIPATVTDIGQNSFTGCKNITQVTMPTMAVPYIFKAIGSEINLEKFVINGGDTVDQTLFYNGLMPYNIKLGIVEINNVDSIESSFFDLKGITSLKINNVTTIGKSAFSNCGELVDLEINNVETIGEYAFQSCSALTSLDMSGITNIEFSAFFGCSSLTSVKIPYGVIGISNYTFANCNSLASVEIPSSVTSIGMYAFKECIKLSKIVIPSSVTSIDKYAFWYTGMTIYCEAESLPIGWDEDWNVYYVNGADNEKLRRPVQWNYKSDDIA